MNRRGGTYLSVVRCNFLKFIHYSCDMPNMRPIPRYFKDDLSTIDLMIIILRKILILCFKIQSILSLLVLVHNYTLIKVIFSISGESLKVELSVLDHISISEKVPKTVITCSVFANSTDH